MSQGKSRKGDFGAMAVIHGGRGRGRFWDWDWDFSYGWCGRNRDNVALVMCRSLQGPCRRGQEREKGGAGRMSRYWELLWVQEEYWCRRLSQLAQCDEEGMLGVLCGETLVSFFGGDDLALGQVVCDSFGDGAIVYDTATDVPVDEGEH